MPLFPAAKLMDPVIGLDFHTVFIPPSPVPVPLVPHPYCGALFLWNTPQFPTFSSGAVLINGMPACTVGAMGYCCHVPCGLPAPPMCTNLMSYWRHHLVQVPKALVLIGLTTVANIAIAGIASLIPKPASADSFLKDVTGIDTSSRASAWETVKGSFSTFTKWQTWVHLLLPPIPFPGAQGSTAVGSPNVTVNGGPLAFTAPLVAASCSEIPVVPNAATLGFSNVMVGVSFADLLRGIAVHSAQGAISHAVVAGVNKATGKRPGQADCGCG
jgi:uncharacterized Zn-binding protein involved in type VI secretion